MAKTVFQKNQRVWVESVGCWATIEKIVPIWAKGFDEPVRVTYDVGLGREFQAAELKAEDIFAKEVKSAGVAFHSPFMATIAPGLLAALKKVGKY